MKTSNKLLITAVLVILISLTVHDLALKAAYLKTDYKNRFYQMEKLPLADFDAVDLKPSAFTTVTIEQGAKFAVWINNTTKSEMSVNKDGRTLKIFYKVKTDDYTGKNIIIICPSLKSMVVHERSADRDFTSVGDVIIHNFDLDSLYVRSARGTNINLYNNIITLLNAGTNITGGKISLPTNRIKQSNVNMQGPGSLELYDKKSVGKATYNLSPGTTVTLGGDALSMFSH
jgi:hypothetical protein